mmetsp:Transcript_31940/g.31341  ORF Transcript_31940/g.31341 Transcript_31940/m.31341 type:complete len:162 (-) Transcript_31940:1904-2389(-)
MKIMQQAKQDYEIYIDDPEEDDMEKEFLQSMSNELQSTAQYEQTDQYTAALTKLEEIKKNQNDLEEVKKPTSNDNDDFGQLDDYLEEQITNEYQHLMDEDNLDSNQPESRFREKYDNLIQNFSEAIKNRQNLPLIEISNITDKIWDLVDEWRDHDLTQTKE